MSHLDVVRIDRDPFDFLMVNKRHFQKRVYHIRIPDIRFIIPAFLLVQDITQVLGVGQIIDQILIDLHLVLNTLHGLIHRLVHAVGLPLLQLPDHPHLHVGNNDDNRQDSRRDGKQCNLVPVF